MKEIKERKPRTPPIALNSGEDEIAIHDCLLKGSGTCLYFHTLHFICGLFYTELRLLPSAIAEIKRREKE
jgi:hypothetical protein